MFAMERYVQRTIVIIMLAIMGCTKVSNPYLLLFIVGLLLCVQCESSLTEQIHACSVAVQIVLAVSFVAISGDFFTYLIFGVIVDGAISDKTRDYRYLEIGFPAVVYLIAQLILQKKQFPVILCHMLILIAVSALLYCIQYLIENYLTVKRQVSKAVSVTAVNEMYAKKLNQELVIKNYLAEKKRTSGGTGKYQQKYPQQCGSFYHCCHHDIGCSRYAV